MAAPPARSREPVAAEATGFWRLERPAEAQRTWLIAPDGRATFWLALNTVMRDTRRNGHARCHRIDGYIRRRDPTSAAQVEWARLSDGECEGFTVPRPYWFNSVGAFSQANDFDASGGDSYMIRPPEQGGAGAPFAVVLGPAPAGPDRALKDEHGAVLIAGLGRQMLGDPFAPAFLADLDALVDRDVAPRRDDPRLQFWFAGNENGIFDVAQHGRPGVRDLRRWVWSDVPAGSSLDRPLCARHALAAHLRERYARSIAALNAAWESAYADFAEIVEGRVRPVPGVHDCNRRCGEDLQRFVHDHLMAAWVHAVTTRIRRADGNHLLASPRLAIATRPTYRFWAGPAEPQPDRWADAPSGPIGADTGDVRHSPFDLLGRDGQAGFDLVAVNAYTGAPAFPRPWFTDGIHKIQRESGLPVVMSEFGLRARIDGWSNRGGAPAFVPHRDGISDQLQRGRRYAGQIDQFIGFRHIVGAAWHAWSDRFIPDDASLQINLGLVRCSDAARGMRAGSRWARVDDLVAETNRTIMERIAAKTGR
jgi:hypothetical protein